MRAQTRIFSVAATIAWLSATTPGFAQTYAGGSGQASVQVDLGVLDDLPGNGNVEPSYPAPVPSGASPHYHSNRVAESIGDFQTTIIGGGDETVAPVTPVYSSKISPYTPARTIPAKPHHSYKVVPSAPRHTHTRHHIEKVRTGKSSETRPIMTTEELNYLQLTAGSKPVKTAPSNSPLPVREVAAVPTPQLSASPLDQAPPSQAPNPDTIPMPVTPPPRLYGSAEAAPTPLHNPNVPPPLPATRPVAMQQPAHDAEDYDQAPRMPAAYKAAPPPPSLPSTTNFGAIGYYDIPYRISTARPAPVAPVLPVDDVNTVPVSKISASPLDQTPPSEPPDTTSMPVAPPPRLYGSADSAPKPLPSPNVPPPPLPVSRPVALQQPAPDAEDYDQAPRMPAAYKAAPPPPASPPPVPIPAATPDDLLDKQTLPSAPASQGPLAADTAAPAMPSTNNSGKIGYYDIPSKVSLNNAAPVAASADIAPLSPPVAATQQPPPAAPPLQPTLLKVAAPVSDAAVTPVTPPISPSPPSPMILDGSLPVPAPIPAAPPPPAQANTVAKAAPPAPVKIAPARASDDLGATVKPITPAVSTAASPMILDGSLPVPAPIPAAPPPPAQASVAPKIDEPPAPIKTSPASASDDFGVTFAPSVAALTPDTMPPVDALAARLKQNPDLRVELRSVASLGKDTSSKARRVSLSRALEIKSYLARQGISEDRIDVRALGAPAGQTQTDRVDFFVMR